MSMAVVVRVKRSLSEEPLEALILSCKKRKTNAESDDSVTAVFKFAGTVAKQDDSINENLSKLLGKQGIKDSTKSTVNVLQKARLQTKTQSENSRYKLVNYFRALDETVSETEGDDKGRELTVLDVEANPKAASSEASGSKSHEEDTLKKQEADFVYDLYEKEPDHDLVDLDDLLLDGMVSFNPLDSELVFDSYRGHRAQDGESDSEDNNDDEDSNDENNWRNDYPDEDEMNSDDGELGNNLERVHIGNEELSSDEDGFDVYDEKLSTDELLYGSRYAQYKKRICEELEGEEESNNSSRSSSCSDLSGLDQDD